MTRFERIGTDKFMAFVFRLLVSVCIIIFCSQLGRKVPSLAGLIAVMPLTGLVVLLWLYSENPGDPELNGRIYQRCDVRPCADRPVLSGCICLFSQAPAAVDGALRKFCRLGWSGPDSSGVDWKIMFKTV